MRKGILIFGTFLGISEPAFEALRPFLDFDVVEFAHGRVTIEHEGWRPDLDELAARVAAVMQGGPDLESGLDEINHDLNIISRWAMRPGGQVRHVERGLNDVVQPYEWSG